MKEDFIILPNPDFVKRKQIEEQIKNNDGYCISTMFHDDSRKCICEEFKNQNHTGWCRCKQYYKILKLQKVCLCGSTKFKEQFFQVARELSLKGYMVTMPSIFIHSDQEHLTPEEREYLNDVHKAKIVDADLVYVINKDGYIGDDTRDEIMWAMQLGKKVQYLEENLDKK